MFKKIILLSGIVLLGSVHAEDKPAAPNKESIMESAKVILDSYVYHPIITYFIQNSAESLSIEKLGELIRMKIKKQMDKFIEIGREAQKLSSDKADLKSIREKHTLMADMLYALQPVEPIVRNMYPRLNKLFDQLVALRENLDYSIVDTEVIVKETDTKQTQPKEGQ